MILLLVFALVLIAVGGGVAFNPLLFLVLIFAILLFAARERI